MFGLFKRPSVHEALSLQLQDIEKMPKGADRCKAGRSCDALPGATGPFGSSMNPIPVNAVLGEIKYLAKLRAKSGYALFFHRLGHAFTMAGIWVDDFEVVSMDGTQWATLSFDFCHPRRSNLAPEGFQLTPMNQQLQNS